VCTHAEREKEGIFDKNNSSNHVKKFFLLDFHGIFNINVLSLSISIDIHFSFILYIDAIFVLLVLGHLKNIRGFLAMKFLYFKNFYIL